MHRAFGLSVVSQCGHYGKQLENSLSYGNDVPRLTYERIGIYVFMSTEMAFQYFTQLIDVAANKLI